MAEQFSPPQSSVARFGVTVIGAPFEWSWYDEGTSEIKTEKFRARGTFSFDDTLDYNAITAEMQTHAYAQTRETAKQVAMLQDPDIDDEALVTALTEFRKASVAAEQAEWRKLIEQTCMLVVPSDVERLRELLVGANPKDVRALREFLEAEVLGRVKAQVEAEARVDPTLPTPPSTPSADPESGEPSDSTD